MSYDKLISDFKELTGEEPKIMFSDDLDENCPGEIDAHGNIKIWSGLPTEYK